MPDALIPEMPEAIILCGGAGLRLRSVTGATPKSLASIVDRPFLDLLLRQLQRHGFHRVVLAVGYQKDAIRAHFGKRAFDLELAYSEESSPLGTGGAIRNALDLVESEAALVMNGDSYTGVDLVLLARDHQQSKADASVVIVSTEGRSDCGFVLVDQNRKIVKFEEKQSRPCSQYVNAGVYLLNRRLFRDVPAAAEMSLERELLPKWLAEGRDVRAYVHAGACVDIGTPERYQSAQRLLATVETAESGATIAGGKDRS